MRYLPPIIFLFSMTGITWIIFFELNLLNDTEKRLAGIFALLGLTLGVFQFWVSEINNNKRKEFDLKYEAYKECIQILDSITMILNEEMGDLSPNPHKLSTTLLNSINQFYSFVHMNSDFLFKGLEKKPEALAIRKILEQILVETESFRKKIDDSKNKSESSIGLVVMIEGMNWHNQIHGYLKNLHNSKYLFYEIVRRYF